MDKRKASKLIGVIISSVPDHHLMYHLAPEETLEAEKNLPNKYITGKDGKPEFVGKESLPDGVKPSRAYVPTLADIDSPDPAAKERISHLLKTLTEAVTILSTP